MRKTQFLVLSLLLMFLASTLAAGCGSSTSTDTQKPIALKAYDSQPDGYPTVQALPDG